MRTEARSPISASRSRFDPGVKAVLGLAMVSSLALVAIAAIAPAKADDAEAATVVAEQIRKQGIACEAPVTAARDTELSAPHQAVWNLRCKNAVYRVRLVPNSAAKVEELQR